MQNPQIYTSQGRMVYQAEWVGTNGVYITKAVHHESGNFWQYLYCKGGPCGTPIRGKARQRQILEFVAAVQAALKTT